MAPRRELGAVFFDFFIFSFGLLCPLPGQANASRQAAPSKNNWGVEAPNGNRHVKKCPRRKRLWERGEQKNRTF